MNIEAIIQTDVLELAGLCGSDGNFLTRRARSSTGGSPL